MIELQTWTFAAPPKTACRWFLKTFPKIGIALPHNAAAFIHTAGAVVGKPGITFTRPVDEWLASFFAHRKRGGLNPGGSGPGLEPFDRLFEIPVVSSEATWAEKLGLEEQERREDSTLAGFVEEYLERFPGTVSELFALFAERSEILIPIDQLPDELARTLYRLEIPFEVDALIESRPKVGLGLNREELPEELRAKLLEVG